MTNADKKLKEMLDVIEWLCRYDQTVDMYTTMVLRDIGFTLKTIEGMDDTMKEDLLG